MDPSASIKRKPQAGQTGPKKRRVTDSPSGDVNEKDVTISPGEEEEGNTSLNEDSLGSVSELHDWEDDDSYDENDGASDDFEDLKSRTIEIAINADDAIDSP